MKLINYPLSLILLLGSVGVHAEIFKCEKNDGTVFYNDKPCPVAEKETKFDPIKDPKNGYVPSYEKSELINKNQFNQRQANVDNSVLKTIKVDEELSKDLPLDRNNDQTQPLNLLDTSTNNSATQDISAKNKDVGVIIDDPNSYVELPHEGFFEDYNNAQN